MTFRAERNVSLLMIATFVLIALVCSKPAFADIIYSGKQNISLKALTDWPDPVNNVTPYVELLIPLGSIGGSDHTLNLKISPGYHGSVAYAESGNGGDAGLLSTADLYPWTHKLDYGDPFPSNPLTGGDLIWDYQPDCCIPPFLDKSEFRDSGGYAAMVFGQPQYRGWVYFRVNDYTTSRPKLTVVDWAYSDVLGQAPYMGEGRDHSPVPEPASTLLLLGPVLLCVIYAARRWPKHGSSAS